MEDSTEAAATAAGNAKEAREDYRNPILAVDQRVEDLLGRMTLAEKAGMLFQTMIVVGSGDLAERSSTLGVQSAEHMINNQLLTHFNVVRAADDARALAEWHNQLQELAASTRLGIPITLSTDPRNHFTENVGTAAAAGTFSQWPETLGLAAIEEVAAQYGEIVADPADADVALLRLKAAYEPRPGGFEAMFHTGSLEFPAEERDHHAALCSAVPTIVDVYLDRPAILTDLAHDAAAVLGSFGSSDEAFLDIVFGAAQPAGSLPFDLPRSMAAVEVSRSDVPFDTADPLFRFGHGLRYPDRSNDH
jgi:hypothetical protein